MAAQAIHVLARLGVKGRCKKSRACPLFQRSVFKAATDRAVPVREAARIRSPRLGHPLLIDGPFFVAGGLKVFYETAMTVPTEAENESMLLAWSAGVPRKFAED